MKKQNTIVIIILLQVLFVFLYAINGMHILLNISPYFSFTVFSIISLSSLLLSIFSLFKNLKYNPVRSVLLVLISMLLCLFVVFVFLFPEAGIPPIIRLFY